MCHILNFLVTAVWIEPEAFQIEGYYATAVMKNDFKNMKKELYSIMTTICLKTRKMGVEPTPKLPKRRLYRVYHVYIPLTIDAVKRSIPTQKVIVL
jgi:hypothetical protein